MNRGVLALCALCVVPQAGRAQAEAEVTERIHYAADVPACLSAAFDPPEAEECIGQGSMACMEAEADGYTTTGMIACTLAEQAVWDVELNRVYREAVAVMRVMDAEDAPEFATRLDSLRTAQRAWITLRDADCALEYAVWGTGSMRGLAAASCQLDQTARRTIFLDVLAKVQP